MDFFKRLPVRIVFIVLLYLFLLYTGSITGFLCNLICLLILLLINKGKRFKTIGAVLLIVFVVLIGYNYLKSENNPVVLTVETRIQLKYDQLLSKDYNSASSERSKLWESNYSYYNSQTLLKRMFGGNYLTDFGFDNNFKQVSHQTYLDMLLNFGFVGAFFLLAFYISKFIKLLNQKTSEEYQPTRIMICLIWFFYAFGLSMVTSWMFLFFFFL